MTRSLTYRNGKPIEGMEDLVVGEPEDTPPTYMDSGWVEKLLERITELEGGKLK